MHALYIFICDFSFLDRVRIILYLGYRYHWVSRLVWVSSWGMVVLYVGRLLGWQHWGWSWPLSYWPRWIALRLATRSWWRIGPIRCWLWVPLSLTGL